MFDFKTKRVPSGAPGNSWLMDAIGGVVFALVIALALSAAGRGSAKGDEDNAKPAASEPGAEQLRFFKDEVRPILKARCFKCHGDGKLRGGLRLNSRAGLLKGGETGPAVSIKKPETSLLLEAINYGDYEMPPDGKLPQEQIDVLTRWVKMGAPWTPGEETTMEPAAARRSPQVNAQTKNFWSFRPVVRPQPPSVKNAAWVTNPIDAFVLARLEAAGLSPPPAAGKAALLRRAYYDLIGLPPSPAETEAFLADASPKAFENVVDRLLKSPHYGEKWARHWLDLVRYAETNSYERDGLKPNAWRYRDYVIRAFNNDMPYDRFIREQLAGDEIDGATRESLIATGYYRLGIWDDEPVDPQQALYDDLDDILTVTSQVFLGLTINCCRCHDHKLDPIPQQDYYRMLAFFGGVTRFGVRSQESIRKASLRPIASEEEKRRQAKEIAGHQAKVRENDQRLAAIEALVRGNFLPVEKQDFKHERNRVGIVKKRVPAILSEEQFQEYRHCTQERNRLRRFRPTALDMALCVTEIGAKSREMHVLVRGNPHAKGEKVEPGFPSVLGASAPVIEPRPSTAHSCGRRLALALWIASPDNQLTARVMVNRIWQHHFGRGIVRSPNNFGMKGRAPTHPELLDWLASEFVAHGWSMKEMHKRIMLSSAYRMSSQGNTQAAAIDPENDRFWRFDMRRLTAEEIRDSILAVNGSINLKTMFGPSIYPVIPQAVLAGQSRPGAGWGKSSPEDRARRSIYIHQKRSLVTPILAAFDAAETDASCPVRFSTTQPTQALGMLNGDFLNEQAKVFAAFLRREAGDKPASQVRLALARALQRPPREEEVARGVNLIESFQTDERVAIDDALTYFCLVALNLNEFVYLD